MAQVEAAAGLVQTWLCLTRRTLAAAAAVAALQTDREARVAQALAELVRWAQRGPLRVAAPEASAAAAPGRTLLGGRAAATALPVQRAQGMLHLGRWVELAERLATASERMATL